MKVSNKYGAISYSGETWALISKLKPNNEPSRACRFKLYQRDNALDTNCVVFESISKAEKRKLIGLWSISGRVRANKNPSEVMVNLAKMGMVIISTGYYQLTKRGNYYARCLKENPK